LHISITKDGELQNKSGIDEVVFVII